MAGFAAGFILFIKPAVVLVYPANIIHVMKAMRAVGGQRKAALGMADCTLDYLAGVALKRLGCHIVIGGIVSEGPLGVRAAMTVFAANAAVPFAKAI